MKEREREKMNGVTRIEEHTEFHTAVGYRPIEAVAVVVKLSSFFQKVKLDPVVETRHLPALDFTYSVNECVS